MSTQTLFFFAVGVFALMITGIVLTGVEFKKMSRNSRQKERGLSS